MTRAGVSAALVIVGSGVGCLGAEPDAGASRTAVVDGTPAATDPAVVALLPRRARCDEGPPSVPCSGTLIGPRVVLTAAHCFEVFGAQAGHYEVYFGDDVFGDGGTFVVAEHLLVHPGFDPDTHAMDLALVRLAEPAPAEPHALPAVTLDPAMVGATVRVVGYGLTRDDTMPLGVKREGTLRITEVSEESFRAERAPSMTCQGDSGGPVLLEVDGVEHLVGVTASGDPACDLSAFNVRVDAALDGFVRPYLEETASLSPRGSGGSLAAGELCAGPCAADADCPFGMVCEAGLDASRCRLAALAPGAFGDPCASDAECSGDGATCARVWPSGADPCRCHAPCVTMPPPDGDDSGCGVAPGSRGSGGAAWLLVLLGVLLRRSRQ